jgi:FkbM family methyltransferase
VHFDNRTVASGVLALMFERCRLVLSMGTMTGTRYIFGKSITLSGNDSDTYLSTLISSLILPEQDIVNLIGASCSSDSHMLDVGANIGYISIIMSLTSPAGKIYSFEPGPKIFSFLKKNVKDNRLKNVDIHNIGLSDKNYTTKLAYSSDMQAGAFVSNDPETVKVKYPVSEDIKLEALDSVYKKLGIVKCDLLKVDIEGHELSFLSGAKNFISKFKPTTIMEVNHWCLNVLNRTSLPDYIESVYTYFPYIFAFQDGQYLDLSDPDALFYFYYENVVNNSFFNLFCGFDRNQLLNKLNLAFDDRVRLNEVQEQNAELTKRNAELTKRFDSLESSKSHQVAKKVNRMLRR